MAGDKPAGKPNVKPGNPAAVDGLTPPTMKPAATEATQIGPAPTPDSSVSRTSRTSATITGDRGTETLLHDVAMQDLSTERLLRDATRADFAGKQCPSLNKIPLVAKIGQGGMGAVYYGIHPRLRSEVAVKVLPFHLAEQDPGMIRRFFREAQIAAQVHSPHLVNVMDVNEESGLFFLVMEYVHGKTAGQMLKMLLEKGQPGFAEVDALDVCLAACEGLQAAHLQGIVHRDLKPENIMVPYLSRNDKNFDLKRAKLMDLGLARSEDSTQQSLTGVQAAMGTPGYMSPEQALDAKTADKRSDVWGMGATLYALLAGRAPFRGEAVMKVLMSTMHEPHVPVNKVRPEISATLSEIIDRCLEKKQENRFQDAGQLIRAMKNCRRLQTKGGAESQDDLDGVEVPPLTIGQRGIARTIVTGGATGTEATMVGPLAGVGVPSGTRVSGVSSGTQVSSAGLADATVIGPQPGAPAPAAAGRGKAKAFAAVGALVIVAGIAGFAVFGRRTPMPDQPNRPPDPPVQPVNKYSAEELASFRKSHAESIKYAKSHIDAGDVQNARINLRTARIMSKEINEKAIFDIEREVEGLIGKAEAKIEFQRSLAQIDTEIQNRDLQKAADLLRTLKGADEECAKQLEQKTDLVNVLQRAKIRRDTFLETLKAANDLPPEKIDDAAKAKLDAAGRLLPPEEEAKTLLAVAPWLMPDKDQLVQVQNKFSEVLRGKANERKYRQLIEDAEANLDAQKKVDLLQDALALFPQRDEVRQKLAKAREKLSEADRQRLARDNEAKIEQQFTEAYNRAQQLQDKDPDGALAAVNEALDIKKNDALATQLKAGLEKAHQKRRDREKFKNFLTAAAEILDSRGNLETAEASLRDAKKLFENDPELANLQTRLENAKNEAARRNSYLDLVAKAQQAMADNKVADTRNHYKAALLIDGTGKELKGVATWLEAKDKEEAKRLNDQQKYQAILKDALEFEKAGDSRLRPEEQVSDYNKALAKYDEAKAFGAAKDVATLKEKLAKAEAARKQADLAAAQEVVRKEYQQKWVAAESAGGMEQWDDAMTAMQAAKALLKDNPAFAAEREKADKKIADYRAARDQQAAARAQQATLAARTAIATKIGAKDFRNASLEAEKFCKANATAGAALRDVLACLAAMQTINSSLDQIAAQLPQIDKKLNDRGKKERGELAELSAALSKALDDARQKLSAPDLKEAAVLARPLQAKATESAQVSKLLAALEAISKKAPDDAPPLDVPEPKPKPKPDPKPKVDPKPKNGSGGVGENIPD